MLAGDVRPDVLPVLGCSKGGMMSLGGFNRDKGAAAGGSTVQPGHSGTGGTHPNNALRGPGRVGGWVRICGVARMCTQVLTFALLLPCTYTDTNGKMENHIIHHHLLVCEKHALI